MCQRKDLSRSFCPSIVHWAVGSVLCRGDQSEAAASIPGSKKEGSGAQSSLLSRKARERGSSGAAGKPQQLKAWTEGQEEDPTETGRTVHMHTHPPSVCRLKPPWPGSIPALLITPGPPFTPLHPLQLAPILCFLLLWAVQGEVWGPLLLPPHPLPNTGSAGFRRGLKQSSPFLWGSGLV